MSPFFALDLASSPWLSSKSFCIAEQLNAECLNRPPVFDKFKLPMFDKTKRPMSTVLALNILSHDLSSARIAAHISVCVCVCVCSSSVPLLVRTACTGTVLGPS